MQAAVIDERPGRSFFAYAGGRLPVPVRTGLLALAGFAVALYLASSYGRAPQVPAHRSSWPRSRDEALQHLRKAEPWRIPPRAQWSPPRTSRNGVATSSLQLQDLSEAPADEALVVTTADGSVSAVEVVAPTSDGIAAWVSARDVLAIAEPDMDRSARSVTASVLSGMAVGAGGQSRPLTIGSVRFSKTVDPGQVTFTARRLHG